MDELLGWLCAIAALLAVITAVGHGLWLIVAWLIAGSSPSRSAGSTGGFCPRCGTPGFRPLAPCDACGYPDARDTASGTPLALGRLLDDLNRFRRADMIDDATHEALCRAVRAEQDRFSELRAEQAGARRLLVEPIAPPAIAPVMAELYGSDVSQSPAPAPGSVAERAERYQARRTSAAAEPESSPVPRWPRKPLTEWLSAFMEEKHIRWGELAGGTLIVCCSIALVISFWSAIAERPLLKFAIFNGVTAALFGAAWYTGRRWGLPTTSQGLSIIATLLVPLNFLAIAAFSRGAAAGGPLTIAGELFSIGLFAALIGLASRTIAVDFRPYLLGGVMASSVAELLVRRWVGAETALPLLYAVAGIPVAACAAATLATILRARRWESLDEPRGNQLFRLLGIVGFAALLAIGVLLARSGEPLATLRRLAPLMAALGACPLATGLVFWQRATDRAAAGIRTAGTSVSVLGALAMVAALGLAWPAPARMLPVAVVEGIVFLGVAYGFELPAALALSGLTWAIAFLVGFHVARGELTWPSDSRGEVFGALVSAASGRALVGFAAAWGAAAVGLLRCKRPVDALFAALVAGAAAAVSLALVSWFGWDLAGDPEGTTWVYAVYAALALTAGARWKRADAAYAGAALLLAALWQGLRHALPSGVALTHPGWAALLTHASLLAAGAWARRRTAITGPFLTAVRTAALATTLAAAVWLTLSVPVVAAGSLAVHFGWLAAVWLLTAWICTGRVAAGLFAGFQASSAASVAFAVAAWLDRQVWFAQVSRPWLDAWTWQAVGIGLAAWGAAWVALSIVARRRASADGAPGRWSALLGGPWRVDRWVSAGLVLGTLLVGMRGAMPGALQELCPHSLAVSLSREAGLPAQPSARVVPPLAAFEFFGTPHEHALGVGSWLLVGAVLLLLLLAQWERYSRWRVLSLVFAAFTFCPLVAGRWESEVAVASALRWTTAVFLLLGSLALWNRDRLARWAAALGSQVTPSSDPSLTEHVWRLLAALTVLPLAAMLAFVATVAVSAHPPAPDVADWLRTLTLVLLGAATLALGARYLAAAGGEVPLSLRAAGSWIEPAGSTLFILGAAPLVAASIYVVGTALRGNGVVGPEPGSLFARMGLAVSYPVPVLLIAVTLVGHALRERSSGFAISAGLLLNLSAMAAYLLGPARTALAFDARLWVVLAQLNAAVAAAYALAWIGALVAARRRRGESLRAPGDPLLAVQATLGIALVGLILVPGAVALFLEPTPTTAHQQLGNLAGWASSLLAVAALGAWSASTVSARFVEVRRALHPATSATIAAVVTWALGAMLSFSFCSAGARDWHGYHALLATHLFAGFVVLTFHARLLATRDGWGARRWIEALALLSAVLAIRAFGFDPQGPWWTVGSLAATAALLAVAAACSARRRMVVAAGVLINLAAAFAWMSDSLPFRSAPRAELIDFVLLNLLALTAPVPVWLMIELRAIRPAELPLRRRAFPWHGCATVIGVTCFALCVAVGLSLDAGGQPLSPNVNLVVLAWIATTVAVFSCLWDGRSRSAPRTLYAWGLVSAGLLVDCWNLSPRWQLFTGGLVLAAYTVATSYLWSTRRGLATLARAVRLPRRGDDPQTGDAWIVVATGALVAVVVGALFGVVLTFEELTLRQAAGQAALCQGLAVGLLARGARRSLLQSAALLVTAVGAVAFGWAWLTPGASGTFLHYAVVANAALALAAVAYGFLLVKLFPRWSEWTAAAERLVPLLTIAVLATAVLVVGTEAAAFARQLFPPIAWPAILTVSATLLGLAVAALAAALMPGRDPFGLSERGRTAYVYAAESLLALLALHIRLSMPWLFHGWFERYWPLIVMFVAFVGVGLGEWFRRQQRPVLSQPLEQTAALLPVLPVLGFWMIPASVHYSLLLLAVGTLYAWLSLVRRSFGFGVLAALSVNGGMWYLLNTLDGLGLAQHPQVWLIPPALCVLAAAYLNHQRLSAAQMTQVRYLTSMTIYVSSTADIFLNGVAQAPWLPVVLAALSIAGILLGMWLRVRAFLYLGTSFLFVSLLTVIYHAAHELEQTWVWYATGVVAGVLIIALFALFEKKQHEVRQLVQRLRQWEA